MSSNLDLVFSMITQKFPAERCSSITKHYAEMLGELQRSHWESATVKCGKFVESVLKCLWEHCGQIVPADKDFKAGMIIDMLPQRAPAGTKDSIKLTIPRACRFVYEVASNRGARHDSGELDPNVMDANGVSSTCSWILAELIRYSQQGKMSAPQAAEIVSRLTEKKYPLFEEIDGRVYFSKANLSARKIALLLLAYRYPSRMTKEELIKSVMRHGETLANSRKGVERLKPVIDDDGTACFRLRASGLKEAEALLSAAISENGQ